MEREARHSILQVVLWHFAVVSLLAACERCRRDCLSCAVAYWCTHLLRRLLAAAAYGTHDCQIISHISLPMICYTMFLFWIFRMSKYTVDQLPDYVAISDALRAAGDRARQYGHRLTFHPSGARGTRLMHL